MTNISFSKPQCAGLSRKTRPELTSAYGRKFRSTGRTTIAVEKDGRIEKAFARVNVKDHATALGKNKCGLPWQISPLALTKAVFSPDPTVAKHASDEMMKMKKVDLTAIEAASHS